jgi:hypothetical protein
MTAKVGKDVGGKKEPSYTVGGNEISTDTMEVPQKKLKLELPYDPAMPLLGIYPKECRSDCNKDPCTLMFIAALFTIAKPWKQPRCPTTDDGLRKHGIYIQWNFIQQ